MSKKDIEGKHLPNELFGFVFQQQKMRKLDVLQEVAGGHTVHVPGLNVTGLCARFAPTIKWHRITV